ncbi:PCNA-associated factor-like isoform X2 [Cydia fagiglandana]|uniref:PCNA-associated factor-like isoform X2 n=1 Tax=Cydia fagiglandana TaxID=1458189 RepID=UPI002FEE55E3
MARTKASAGAKVASGKSSKARCSVAIPASSSGSSGCSERAGRSGGGGGGNSVCPRETPKWQRPITNFFICKEPDRGSDNEDEGVEATSSKPKAPKPIEGSDEEQQAEEKPKNKELDESIELEPLTGEDSHKIEEYYPKGPKGKGKGKKTKGKENVDSNVERRNSAKRELEEITFGEESEHASKRVKVN